MSFSHIWGVVTKHTLIETVGYACLDCDRVWPRRPNTHIAKSGQKQSIMCAVCQKPTRVEARMTSVKCGKCGLVWSPNIAKMTERRWIRCRRCNTIFLPTIQEMRSLQRAFVPDLGRYLDVTAQKGGGLAEFTTDAA